MFKKISTVIFDFDGTLVDSSEGVINSAIYALSKAGIEEKDREKLNYLIGPPLYKSFNDLYGFNDDKIKVLVDDFQEMYGETGVYECHVYEGMEHILQKLKERGIKVGISSSKPEVYLKPILKIKGIEKYFDAVTGIEKESHHSGKKQVILDTIKKLNIDDKEKDSVLMVGDRIFDIEGARDAGIKSVGVLYGFGNREEFKEADYIVENMAELEKLLIG